MSGTTRLNFWATFFCRLVSAHQSCLEMTPICFVLTKNIKALFKNANDELEKISQSFKANIYSLNEEKTKFH